MPRPPKPAPGWRSVSTPDVLFWKGKYYLYYQAFLEMSGTRGVRQRVTGKGHSPSRVPRQADFGPERHFSRLSSPIRFYHKVLGLVRNSHQYAPHASLLWPAVASRNEEPAVRKPHDPERDVTLVLSKEPERFVCF